MQYKIRLLGDLVVTSEEGNDIKAPTTQNMRTLVALAVRPGEMRSESELTGIVWGEGYDPDLSPDLAVPISRVRNTWMIPIPDKVRNGTTYQTTLARAEVDLTDFVDRVAQLSAPGPTEVDELLGLWHGRPEVHYSFLPKADLAPLKRARRTLISHLEKWTPAELATLVHLDRFRELYEDECAAIPTGDPVPTKRLLVVDDDEKLTEMLEHVLVGYELVVAHDIRTAMGIVTDRNIRLDGALVDLHLSPRALDSQGLQVLAALRSHRPAVPRVLMTSSPPGGPVSELHNQYDLFETLVKNSAEAPDRTRWIVDEMMSDQDGKVIARATIALETLSGRVMVAAGRAVATARRRIRIGETVDQTELETAQDQLEALSSTADDTLVALGSAGTGAEASAIVERYAQEHRKFLDPSGTP